MIVNIFKSVSTPLSVCNFDWSTFFSPTDVGKWPHESWNANIVLKICSQTVPLRLSISPVIIFVKISQPMRLIAYFAMKSSVAKSKMPINVSKNTCLKAKTTSLGNCDPLTVIISTNAQFATLCFPSSPQRIDISKMFSLSERIIFNILKSRWHLVNQLIVFSRLAENVGLKEKLLPDASSSMKNINSHFLSPSSVLHHLRQWCLMGVGLPLLITKKHWTFPMWKIRTFQAWMKVHPHSRLTMKTRVTVQW